jgi:uncharacterized protein (DUF362 family)
MKRPDEFPPVLAPTPSLELPRRRFLGLASSAAVGVGLGVPLVGCGEKGSSAGAPAVHLQSPSQVAVMRDAAAVNDASRVAGLVQRAVSAATGQSDPAAAWRQLFTPEDVVGLKLNCVGGKGLSPTWPLVDAICAALREVGIPDENIIIWEQNEKRLRAAGFEPREEGPGPRIIATDLDPKRQPEWHEPESVTSGKVTTHLTRILTRRTTATINVGVLKQHEIAGLSAALKNMTGAISNMYDYHADACDPYVADVYAIPAIREHTRLHIIDALTAQARLGPEYQARWAWPFGGVIAGVDPVAIDRIALDIIEERRAELGLQTLKQRRIEPRWIGTAGRYGLGTSEREKIEVLT